MEGYNFMELHKYEFSEFIRTSKICEGSSINISLSIYNSINLKPSIHVI